MTKSDRRASVPLTPPQDLESADPGIDDKSAAELCGLLYRPRGLLPSLGRSRIQDDEALRKLALLEAAEAKVQQAKDQRKVYKHIPSEVRLFTFAVYENQRRSNGWAVEEREISDGEQKEEEYKDEDDNDEEKESPEFAESSSAGSERLDDEVPLGFSALNLLATDRKALTHKDGSGEYEWGWRWEEVHFGCQ